MTHADIIARLTAATGPDARLDEAIWGAIGGWPEPEWRSVNYMKVYGTPVTASVDATLALIDRVLPGATWRLDQDGAQDAEAKIWHGETIDLLGSGEATTPPLAALLALFRALEAQGVPHHG